jgi:ribosome biogenesis GTPase
MKATVYKSTGSWYWLKDEFGDFHKARIKGKFKIGNLSSTNPIAVGDEVIVEKEVTMEDYMIVEIETRKNYITRTSPHNKNQQHIVASNLDQSILLATYKDPKTSTGFIDRFLVTAEAYRVPAILVFNKTDLLNETEREGLNEVAGRYEKIGYQTLCISLAADSGVNTLENLLTSKRTLISGHSGVGKSTLINRLYPNFNLRTQDVSSWSGKGMHTTTFAEMFDLIQTPGSIIDTPGIRELGLFKMEKSELAHFFPEMRSRMNDCQFNNCLHVNEPHCAIKNAVLSNDIHEERYLSYLNILESLESDSY